MVVKRFDVYLINLDNLVTANADPAHPVIVAPYSFVISLLLSQSS